MKHVLARLEPDLRDLVTEIVRVEIERRLGQLPASNDALPAPVAVRDVISAREAAAMLGVDRNTLYEQAGAGKVPHRRVGRRMIFSRSALEEWLRTADTRKGR